MDRRKVLAVLVYAALIAALALPAFGDDDWLAILVLLAAVHLGLGAAVRRPWAIALPIGLSLVAFLASGAADLAWLTLLFGTPVMVALTLAGWGLGRLLPGDAAALGCLAVAAVPVAAALVEQSQRGPHVPASVQQRLPTRLSLGNLCPDAETPPDVERDLRRRADVLIRELERRPTHLVTDTEYDAHGGDEWQRDITIRELAEQHLDEMQPDCAPDVQRRLRAAL